MFRKKKRRGDIGKHKFCPVCGTKAELSDNVCTNCGYSFAHRAAKKKKKKGIKWRNVIFLIIILIIAYLSIRYFNSQPIIPTSIEDALSLNITLDKNK